MTTAASSSSATKTILLVEDDTILSAMYSQRFSKEGYKVILAQNGEDGLNLALKNNIDLVLTDIMLPKISGIELIKKLKGNTKKANIPIIAWSNLSDESEKESALKLGAEDFLIKGKMSLNEVVDTVKKYLA